MSKATQRHYDIILGAQNGKPIEDFDPPLKAKEIEFYNSVLEDCARIRAEGREPMFELPVDYEADYEKDEDNEPDETPNNQKEQDNADKSCKEYGELKPLGFTLWISEYTDGKPHAISNVAVNNEVKYRIVDDEMKGELWFTLDEEGYCDYFASIFRSDNKNKLRFEYWNKDEEDKDISLARLSMLNEWEIPFNAQIVDCLALKDIKEGDEVIATITCLPDDLSFYEDAESCKLGNKGLAVESFMPIGTFPPNEDMAEEFVESAFAIMSGKVKSYEKRTNKLTGLKYVHFVVESLGMVYDLVAAEDEISLPPEKIEYISGVVYLSAHIDTKNYQRQGNSWKKEYDKKLSEEQFRYEVADTLETLRDMAYEHFIADFSKADKYPVEFIQTALYKGMEKGKDYLIEYGKPDSEGNPLLYRLAPEDDFCSFDMAKKIFHTVCVEGKEPLEWNWKDVTYIIRGEKEE